MVGHNLLPSSCQIPAAVAAKGGRNPHPIKWTIKLLPIVAPTDSEAETKDAELRLYTSNESAAVLVGGCAFIYSRLQTEVDVEFWICTE